VRCGSWGGSACGHVNLNETCKDSGLAKRGREDVSVLCILGTVGTEYRQGQLRGVREPKVCDVMCRLFHSLQVGMPWKARYVKA
jgi:hypothetical protein